MAALFDPNSDLRPARGTPIIAAPFTGTVATVTGGNGSTILATPATVGTSTTSTTSTPPASGTSINLGRPARPGDGSATSTGTDTSTSTGTGVVPDVTIPLQTITGSLGIYTSELVAWLQTNWQWVAVAIIGYFLWKHYGKGGRRK